MSRTRLFLLSSLLMVLISSCGPSERPISQSEEREGTNQVVTIEQSEAFSADSDQEQPNPLVEDQAYPPPQNPTPVMEYPPPEDAVELGAYPPPQEPARIYEESKRFSLDAPIRAGEMGVRGTGPPSVSIDIVNVSYVGEIVGSGTIDADGSFEIDLIESLKANHVIGIKLSDPSLENDYRDAPGSSDLPMIGLILATAVVQP